MPLGGNRARELSGDDIRALIGEPEDIGLDFKRELYNDRHDLCIDVSAMANSAGGHIVVGVEEANGRGTVLKLMPPDRARKEAERMRSWAHDWIRPRVPDLEIGPVEVESGGYVIVIRVPQSAISPHMVTTDHRTQFCRRYQDGNREMTHEEIRAAFLGDSALVGIEEVRVGIREVLRGHARERAVRTAADPNRFPEADLVQGYMERRLREWMEREDDAT